MPVAGTKRRKYLEENVAEKHGDFDGGDRLHRLATRDGEDARRWQP